jgi:hypothetical protein
MDNKLSISNKNATIGNINPQPSNIIFQGKDGLEILKLEDNGDIFVNGKLIENDKQVIYGLRKFLSSHEY